MATTVSRTNNSITRYKFRILKCTKPEMADDLDVKETYGAPDSVCGQYFMLLSLSSNTRLERLKVFA